MIAGLEDISDGELYIGDRVVNDVAPKGEGERLVFSPRLQHPGAGDRPRRPGKNGDGALFGPVLAEKVNFLPIPSFFYSCDTKKTVLSSEVYAMTYVVRRMVLDRVVLCGHHYFTAGPGVL